MRQNEVSPETWTAILVVLLPSNILALLLVITQRSLLSTFALLLALLLTVFFAMRVRPRRS